MVQRPAATLGTASANLTQREWEVLASIADGRTTREIAGEFDLSPETVRTHLRRIFAKLGVHTRSEAVQAGFVLLLASDPWIDLRDFYRLNGGWSLSGLN